MFSDVTVAAASPPFGAHPVMAAKAAAPVSMPAPFRKFLRET